MERENRQLSSGDQNRFADYGLPLSGTEQQHGLTRQHQGLHPRAERVHRHANQRRKRSSEYEHTNSVHVPG